MQICHGYMKSTCMNTNCCKLHVCKYHVIDECFHGAKCKYSHNVLDEELKLYQQGFERRMIQALPQLLNDARNIRSCTVDGEGKLCDMLSFVSYVERFSASGTITQNTVVSEVPQKQTF